MARPQVDLGLDNVLQAIIEQRKEGRAKADREQRIEEALKLQRIVYGEGTPEAKREAGLRLRAIGVNVPESLIKKPFNYQSFFKEANTPEEWQKALQMGHEEGFISGDKFFGAAVGLGEPSAFTIEGIQQGIDIGAFKGTELDGLNAEQTKKALEFVATVREVTTADMANKLFGGEKAEKPTTWESKIKAIENAVTGPDGKIRPIETVIDDPKVMIPLAANSMINQLYEFYGMVPPSAFKAVSATSIFNQAMDTVQERLKNEEKKLGLLEEQIAKIRPGSTGEKTVKPVLEKKLSEQRLAVNELRTGLVDSVGALTGRLQMSGIGGGVNPADLAPAVDSPMSDRTAEYITQLQQLISSGAMDASSITDEDLQEAADNGIDVDRVKRELGLE